MNILIASFLGLFMLLMLSMIVMEIYNLFFVQNDNLDPY
jgi:hypothetical protein